MAEQAQDHAKQVFPSPPTLSYADILFQWLQLLPSIAEQFSEEDQELRTAAETTVRVVMIAATPDDKNYPTPTVQLARNYLNNFLPHDDALLAQENWSNENAILLAALFYFFIINFEHPETGNRVLATLRGVGADGVIMKAYLLIASFEVRSSRVAENGSEDKEGTEEWFLAKIERQDNNRALLARYKSCGNTNDLIGLMCEVLQVNLELYSEAFNNYRKLLNSPKVFKYVFGVSVSVISSLLLNKFKQKKRAALWAQRQVEQKVGLLNLSDTDTRH